MARSLFRRYGNDRHLQPAANDFGDVAHRYAFFCNRTVPGPFLQFLQRQTKSRGRIENVHRRPSGCVRGEQNTLRSRSRYWRRWLRARFQHRFGNSSNLRRHMRWPLDFRHGSIQCSTLTGSIGANGRPGAVHPTARGTWLLLCRPRQSSQERL